MAFRNMSKSSGSESSRTSLRCTTVKTGIDIDPDVHYVRIDRGWSLPKPCSASGSTNSSGGKGLLGCLLLVCSSATVAGLESTWRRELSILPLQKAARSWVVHSSFVHSKMFHIGASDPCTWEQQLTVVGRWLPKSSSTQQGTLELLPCFPLKLPWQPCFYAPFFVRWMCRQ